jgi:hypothetical protein
VPFYKGKRNENFISKTFVSKIIRDNCHTMKPSKSVIDINRGSSMKEIFSANTPNKISNNLNPITDKDNYKKYVIKDKQKINPITCEILSENNKLNRNNSSICLSHKNQTNENDASNTRLGVFSENLNDKIEKVQEDMKIKILRKKESLTNTANHLFESIPDAKEREKMKLQFILSNKENTVRDYVLESARSKNERKEKYINSLLNSKNKKQVEKE